MIAVSAGLATDIAHICEASQRRSQGVGRKNSGSCESQRTCINLALTHSRLALDGGDDYELLFTVPRRLAGRLPRTILRRSCHHHRRNYARQANQADVDRAGQAKSLPARGWDPFRGPRSQKLRQELSAALVARISSGNRRLLGWGNLRWRCFRGRGNARWRYTIVRGLRAVRRRCFA